MTAKQLKAEIRKELNRLPKEALEQTLDFLKKLNLHYAEMDDFLEQTFIEDGKLLERLSQS